MRLRLLTPLAYLPAVFTPELVAQSLDSPEVLDGSFRLGVRTVDVAGNEAKYREDVGLDEGLRLFHLGVDYLAESDRRRFADRIELDLQNLGGDPFETLRFRIHGYGRYELRYDRHKSTYFFDDIRAPSEPSNPPIRDYHSFDFVRTRDSADLELTLTRRARLSLGFDRYSKSGGSTTSLSVARDGFELEQPIDETATDYSAALRLTWPRVTLLLEEGYRNFDNVFERALTRPSEGVDDLDSTRLESYFFSQPYDLSGRRHTVRVTAQPVSPVELILVGSLEDTSADVTFNERSRGTDFLGESLFTDVSGAGEIDRDADLLSLDLSFRATPRWRILASGTLRQLDQAGRLPVDGNPKAGRWDIRNERYELGAEVVTVQRVTVGFGVSGENRRLDTVWLDDGIYVADDLASDQLGLWLDAGWRPSRRTDLELRLESANLDGPYTDTSATDRRRIRLRIRHARPSGLWTSAAVGLLRAKNTESGWDSNYDQIDLRVGYRDEKLDVALGFSHLDIGRQIDQLVAAGPITLPFPILYEADAQFVEGRLRWSPSLPLRLGGLARLYDNDGSLSVRRSDLRGWLEVTVLRSYLVHIGLRRIDFSERAFAFNDYDATIGELSFGYQW